MRLITEPQEQTMKQLHRLFATALLAASFWGSATAGTVTINFVDSTLYDMCAPFQYVVFVDYMTTGYLPTDSVDIYVDFGDGSDTLFGENVQTIFAFAFHEYTVPGTYTVQYIVTGPDLAADTVTILNQVTVNNNCGNITGTVFNDVNANCIIDVGDSLLSGVMLTLTQNAQTVAMTVTDSNGYYDFFVPTGAYDVEVGNNIGNGFTPVCPVSGIINVPTVPSANNDFGLGCGPGFDLTGTFWGWALRPGQMRPFWLDVSNLRCQNISGQVIIVLDPRVSLDTTFNNPPTVIGDSLVWSFTNLSSLNATHLTSLVGLYTDTTVLDSLIYLTLIIEPIAGDMNPADNVDTLVIFNENSWDPNEKEVLPAGTGLPGYIEANQEMEYTVHFQNTGTAEAYDIYLIDTLDSDLDHATFSVVTSSHTMVTTLTNNGRVKFAFDNIFLPDSTTNEPESHGFVKYRIMQQPNLAPGTMITNTAHIFFDYNPAVVTNTTLNTIQFPLAIEPRPVENTTETLQLFPNPAHEVVWIQLPKATPAGTITVYDVHGRAVARKVFDKSSVRLDISHYAPGFYMVVNEAMPGQTAKLLIGK